MNHKNIVIIDHESLSLRKKSNYLLDEFIEKGYDVEYWDCSQYFFAGINFGSIIHEEYCYYIKTLNDLKTNLDRIKVNETIFIVEVFFNWRSRDFFLTLKQRGCYLIKMELYATANVESLTLWERIKDESFTQILHLLSHRLSNMVFKLYCGIKNLKYDLIIGTGSFQYVDIQINHPDWELYKKIKEIPTIYPHKYVVFLDEYFPSHPDIKYYCNCDLNCESEYRQSLNRYFKQIETTLDVKVIIAAHPKSNYSESTFDGRIIIKNDSVSLVKGASAVIMHSSAALSFAIMFNKPILLVSTNDYLNVRQLKNNQLSIAKFLNKKIINIDSSDQFHVDHISSIDRDIRDNYIYSYLTSKETQYRSNIDILNNKFNNIKFDKQ